MPQFNEEIKAVVDDIRSKAGAEVAEKIEDSLISIVTKSGAMVTKFKELESDNSELKSEAYNKRHALKDYRKETDDKIQEYEDKITSFESDNSNEENQAELTRLRDFEKNTIESQRTDFKSFIEGVKDHDNFGKASSRFKLPMNDEGVNFEAFDNMVYDDLKHNLSQMKDLKELEYFDSTPKQKGTPPGGGKAVRGTDASFMERMAAAKTHKEVTAIIDAEGGFKQ